MARSEKAQRAIRQVQGIAFLGVIVILLGFTVLIYNKQLPWQSSDTVTLEAQRIGNQLIIPADVKYKGVLVGRVSDVHSNGDHATLTLQLSKSKIGQIPSNVVARILPKTLFGEKYVDLVNPANPTGSLAAGETILEDRSQTAVELQSVFAKLVPVLKAVNPADLSIALSNTATALQGRGEKLGHNLELINSYFSTLNKDLPNIQHDIAGLADLASNYADAAPDLLAILRNFSVTAKTFTVKQDPYAQFLAGTAGFADTARKFFKRNGHALVKLAKTSVRPLNLLSEYSIVLECLPNGLTLFDRQRLSKAWAGGMLHIDLVPVNDRGAYKPYEKPSLKEFTRAKLPPNCFGLPYGGRGLHPQNSKYPFAPGGKYSKGGFLGSSLPISLPSNSQPSTSAALNSGSTFGVGSLAEQRTIATLLAEINGDPPASDGLGDLLLGPLLRGMVVSP